MKERQIEQKLVAASRDMGGLALKLVSPSCDGMPDRLVLMPGGKVGFVEVKAPGQKARALQLSRHKMLSSLGFKVYVLNNEGQIGGIIDDIQST